MVYSPSCAFTCEPGSIVRTLWRALHLAGSHLSGSPLLWGVAFFLPLLLLFFVAARLGWLHRIARWEDRLLYTGVIAVFAAFGAAAGTYLWSIDFRDHVEPLIAANSWLLWRGEPIYHAVDTQQRHTLPYGPYLFSLHALALSLFGPSTFASKLMAVVAVSGSFAFLWAAIRRVASSRGALLFTGLTAALVLRFGYLAISSRPDPFLIFAVSAALFAATRRGIAAAVLFGTAMGLAVHMKTHGIFYFIPLGILAWRTGWRLQAAVLAATVAVTVTIVPFAFLPHSSASDYLAALRIAAGYRFGQMEVFLCLGWLLTIFLPAVVPRIFARLTRRREDALPDQPGVLYLGAVALSCAAVFVPAAQLGSGPHHFLPFIPLIALYAAEQRHHGIVFPWTGTAAGLIGQSLRWSWLSSCALVAVGLTYFNCARFIGAQPRGLHERDDVRQIVKRHSDKTVLMGVGGDNDYWLTTRRHELVFAGMPATLDPVTMMDFKGRALPEPELAAVTAELAARHGKPVMWVIPRNAAPFSMRTWYAPNDVLFSDRFRADFAQQFERKGSTEFFDLYGPKLPAAGR
jgi:hypothetical protein